MLGRRTRHPGSVAEPHQNPTSSPEDALTRRWADLLTELGLGERADAEATGRDLIERYGEDHRHYHGQRHLLWVLEALDELTAPAPPAALIRLAAWYHDAIYRGVAGDDESLSAELAKRQLTDLGLDRSDADHVAAMVAATARHFDPTAEHDPDTALLLDADLSILGSDPATYDTYCEGVRAEHPDVSDDRFRAGRLHVIESLLARERLFSTERGHDRFEKAARANLIRERHRLADATG